MSKFSCSDVAPSRARRRARAVRAVAAAVALCALFVLGALRLVRDPTPRFAERRSELVRWSEGAPERVGGHDIHTVRLVASSGLEVELLVKRPAPADTLVPPVRRRPVIVIAGGHRTGREAARLIPDTRGTVVAALSYPLRGKRPRKGMDVLRAVPAIRDAILDTPPALMLALDYLLRQPYADSARAELVGVSLGAPFACIAGALDPRFRRVWAIHGSGGSYVPLEHNMRRKIPFTPLRVVAARLADVIAAGPRLAPERWVGRIAPRPFVMVNARDDVQMPRDEVERLYASARAPKEIIWVAGGHVRSRPEVVHPLIELVLSRVLADDGGEERP